MKRKICTMALAFVLCFTLVGCGSKKSEKTKAEEPKVKREITSKALEMLEKYNLKESSIDLEYDYLDGLDDKLIFYMSNEITDENKKEDYKKLASYIKDASDDKVLYDTIRKDKIFNEFSINDLTISVIFNVIINNNKYKVLISKGSSEYNNKQYDTYIINFTEV